MLNPFELLKAAYVERLVGLGKPYLVSQSYPRGINHFSEVPRIPIIVSAYDDEGLAKTHCNAVKEDRYAAIIALKIPKHKAKLLEMIAGSKYEVYWAVVHSAADLEKRINAKYKDNMRRYIEKNTNWRISRETVLTPSIQLIFGELYINLKYAAQLVRIKFEEIEMS